MSRRSWILVVLVLAVILSICAITALGILYAIFGDIEENFGGHNVAVVDVKGIITDSRPVVRSLEKIRKEKGIKGVVVRIDSPGGVVGPTQEIYDAILDLRKKKHVVTSLGGVAASGGYYVALAGEKIVANPGTLTGSIGVRMDFANLERLYEWAKIAPFTLKSGKYKDIGSSVRPMSPQERQLLNKMLDDVHEQFRTTVKDQRKIDEKMLNTLTDGRIFSGQQALKYGLVDELGSLKTAITRVAELSGVKGDPKVFYPMPPKKGILKLLFESAGGVGNIFSLAGEAHPKPVYLME